LEEGAGEVIGGDLDLALELDDGTNAEWCKEDGGGHFGEAESVHIVEVTVEIEGQVFVGGVGDDADGGAWDVGVGADAADDGGFHFDGVGSGFLVERAFTVCGGDDAVGGMEGSRASSGLEQGVGQRKVIICGEEDGAGGEGWIQTSGEAAGEDEFGGRRREGVARGGLGVAAADAGDEELEVRVRLRESSLEWAGFSFDGEGQEDGGDHGRRKRGAKYSVGVR
jgi:hypothetical protein